jgi:arginine deiminase
MGTPFTQVYNRFLGKITDDMYMELTPEDTVRDLRNLLIDAIPGFEFPRINLLDYTIVEAENALEEESSFAADLTSEEVNILAILMMISWTQRQVTSIENTRMKYSSSDFKFTSQANHLAKLLTLLKETQRQSHHMQRLYKRRKTDENGRYESNWSILRDSSALN